MKKNQIVDEINFETVADETFSSFAVSINRPGNLTIVSGSPPPSMILSIMICLRSEDKGFPGI